MGFDLRNNVEKSVPTMIRRKVCAYRIDFASNIGNFRSESYTLIHIQHCWQGDDLEKNHHALKKI